MNGDAKGQFLGEFQGSDRILVIYNDGNYEITNYELINRYEAETVYLIQKFHPAQVIQVVYLEGKSKLQYVKRFVIETSTMEKKFSFIGDEKGSQLLVATTSSPGEIEVTIESKKGEKIVEKIELDDFMEVKGWKVLGNRLHTEKVKKVALMSDRVGEWQGDDVAADLDEVDLDADETDVMDGDHQNDVRDEDSVAVENSAEKKTLAPEFEKPKEEKKPTDDGSISAHDGPTQLNLL